MHKSCSTCVTAEHTPVANQTPAHREKRKDKQKKNQVKLTTKNIIIPVWLSNKIWEVFALETELLYSSDTRNHKDF